MKGIITVIGKDTIGIVAEISGELKRLNINILDINQTIMNSNFTMFMVIDLGKANSDFDTVKKEITQKGKELQVDIKIQREEIFKSMHTI